MKFKHLTPLFFLTFAILPLAAGLVYALLYSLGMVGALGQGFTLQNWQSTLSDVSFWASFGVSIVIAAMVTGISTGLALGLLLWLRPQLEQPTVRFLLHWPLALPPMIAAFFSFQWLGSSGMLARIALHIGWIDRIDDFPNLINDAWYFGVCFTQILLTFPFFLLLLRSHYYAANLPNFAQLAATLGASSSYTHTRIIIPVLLQRAAPTLLLYFVFLLGAFEVPLLLGRQSPAMISIFINQKFNRFNVADLPVAYVVTVVYSVLLIVIISIFWNVRKRTLQPTLSPDS